MSARRVIEAAVQRHAGVDAPLDVLAQQLVAEVGLTKMVSAPTVVTGVKPDAVIGHSQGEVAAAFRLAQVAGKEGDAFVGEGAVRTPPTGRATPTSVLTCRVGSPGWRRPATSPSLTCNSSADTRTCAC